MNGIWIRSEDGKQLVLAEHLTVRCHGSTTILEAETHRARGESWVRLASYNDEEAALCQLDDIQHWMQYWEEGTCGTARLNDEYSTMVPNVYDLRQRKVMEGVE